MLKKKKPKKPKKPKMNEIEGYENEYMYKNNPMPRKET